MKIWLTLMTIIILMSCTPVPPPDYVGPFKKYLVDMSLVNIGDSESDVVESLGKPSEIVAAQKYDDGRIVKVLRYTIVQSYQMTTIPPFETVPGKYFYLYFIDDELTQWRKGGEWEDDVNTVYEIRINTPEGSNSP